MRILRQYKVLGVGFLAIMGVSLASRTCYSRWAKDYQQKIEQADPNRYNRLIKEHNNGDHLFWQREHLKMQDSLRADSFYKEGFKAGQQSIRESLNIIKK